MRPSNSRFIPRRKRPHVEDCLVLELEDFLEVEGWWSVNTATPVVTRKTTRYLYRGYRLRKIVRCKNMTGRSLHDFARMNVM